MNKERSKKNSIAIDLTYSPAKIAISHNGDCRIFENPNLKGGADLLCWIAKILDENDLQISDISEWTIGAGPGAFSQLRILSAEIAGLTFRKPSIKCRAIPSGAAFASVFDKNEINFTVVYQFMKNTITLCRFQKKGMNCKLISVESVKSLELCDFRNEEKPLICSTKFKGKSDFPYLRIVEKYPIDALLTINPNFWDRTSLSKLIYGKPPAVKNNN